MSRLITPRSRVWQSSNTATTGGTITLTGVASNPGSFNFRDRYANGATGVPLLLYDDSTGTYEYSYGTLTYGASAALDTISLRVITYSSSGAGTPIAWGAGTRNAVVEMAPESSLVAENEGSDLNDTQATNFRIRLGVVPGTSTGQYLIAPLLRTTLPSDIGILCASTGGSNSTIVRVSGAGTVIAASNTDTANQLALVLAKDSAGVLKFPGREVPFAGVVAGTVYYLGSAGALTSTPPTVDAGTGVKSLRIGMGLNTGVLGFSPGVLLTYDDGFSPTPGSLPNVKLKNGYLQI